MRIFPFLLFVLLGSVSCIEKNPDNSAFTSKYIESFSNRTTVSVNIGSANSGEYYSVYYGKPYDDEGTLCRLPALTGFTPISAQLDVPKDVTELYVIGEGDMTVHEVKNLSIAPAGRSAGTRAWETNKLPAGVMTAVNSLYFPEKPNNVRGENLFKCTDLRIADTPSDREFEQAQVWLTFLGDGGSRQGGLYGMLWCYTYPSGKMDALTFDDCTFYGVKNNEVVEITYAEMKAKKNCIFDTRREIEGNVSSYKKFSLGKFEKGVNVGFVYLGNSLVGNDGFRFTTPALNPRVRNYTLTYSDTKEKFRIEDNYLANGFICHVVTDGFEGNVLGMENRIVTEGSKYDGDYNDILCLVESNPEDIQPNEDVEIGNTEKPEEIACTTTSGIYLFEDNFPSSGDFDFNDAVIQYEIKDFYQSKNRHKQITVRPLAVGSGMTNSFGYWNSGRYAQLIGGLESYYNVYPTQTFDPAAGGFESVTQSLYGTIEPCMKNGSGYYIYKTNFNTGEYPCVLDIPLSDPDDDAWHFEWPQERASIDDCYWFLKGPDGGAREKDWYRKPKDESLLFKR